MGRNPSLGGAATRPAAPPVGERTKRKTFKTRFEIQHKFNVVAKNEALGTAIRPAAPPVGERTKRKTFES